MKIVHVESKNLNSKIFNDIFAYFNQYKPDESDISVSLEPVYDADILHFHRPQFETSLPVNAIVTVHHDLLAPNPRLPLDYVMERYKEAAAIICLNSQQQAILNRYGVSNTYVIPHGYNAEVLHPKQRCVPSFEGKISLGFFSKRYGNRIKGEAHLQELAKRLTASSYRFVLCGEHRWIEADFLNSLGYEVDYFEYLPYSLTMELYEQIDALLICSTSEGGPASLPEAIATGTTVIATPVGMVPDLVRTNSNAVELTGCPDADAKKINEFFYTAVAEPHAHIDNVQKNIGKNVLSWKEVVQRHFYVYRKVAGRVG